MTSEITPQDRADARKLARDCEALAADAPWAAWLLIPLAKLLRWMTTHD